MRQKLEGNLSITYFKSINLISLPTGPVQPQ